MKFKFVVIVIICSFFWTCDKDESSLNPRLTTSLSRYLKLYIAEHDNSNPLLPDSLPKVALDSITVSNDYEKDISKAKVIDFKQLHLQLTGPKIDVTVSGSVVGCENIVYFLEPANDSLYRLGNFRPGPNHYMSGSFVPDPAKEYPPIYAMFFDTDNENQGVITLNFSDTDTTMSYNIDASLHTVVLDENIYRFKLNHLPNTYDNLALYYLNNKTNFYINDQFVFLIPIMTDSLGYRRIYHLINVLRNDVSGLSQYTISSYNGNITFPDEHSYAFRIKFPHKNK